MTYRPPYFQVDDRDRLLSLIAAHPLATLVTSTNGAMTLTYLPFLAVQQGNDLTLQGHIARKNDQWKAPDGPAVAAFRIADHYISPIWYPTKRQNPSVVPTWDYVAIEARGDVRWIDDRDWVAAFVRRLTESQERRIGSHWSVDDAPAEYLERQYGAIVGVEMRVTELIGTFKLNQNHPRENIDGVIEGLGRLATPQAQGLLQFVRELP